MPNIRYFKTHQDYISYYRNYRLSNARKLRKYNREYNSEWRKKNGYYNEEKSKKKYPRKTKTRIIFNNAFRRGEVKKSSCIICGRKKTQAHHPNYNKPLEVIWYCALHHGWVHRWKKSYRRNLSTP